MTDKSKPKYLSARKMQKVRGSDVPENRKGQSPVKAHKNAIQEQIATDIKLFEELIMVRDIRAAFARGLGIPLEDLSVYAEIGDADLYHQVNVKGFAKWEKLSDMFKGYLGFLLAVEYSGFSFTANVSEELEASWAKNDVDVLDRVKRMLRKQLEKHDLQDIPLFLVVEGKSKLGKSATHLHVHGYFLAEKPLDETRMQKVLEAAFYPKLKTRGRKSKPVEIVRSYEHPDPLKGPAHWVNYSLKNVLKPGSKIRTSKPYLSNSLRSAAKIFWSIIREED